MKNSTLLRLFFISIGLPLTYASSSPPTSSVLTPKSKPNLAPLLADTTNTAPDVQLKDQSSLVQSIPEESQVSGGDKQTEIFRGLIDKGQYEEIVRLGNEMNNEELLKCLCQVVITLDHFKGLFGYLKQRKIVPGFLTHGNMGVVSEVIARTNLLQTDWFGRCDSIYDAIALSFKEDRHNRVADLFEAAQANPVWKGTFGGFVRGFFARYPPEENSMPLKRFLTLHGKELNKKHPAIFGTICEGLVLKLKGQLSNPTSQKLLIDLVGQPSLLTPVAFAEGFLEFADDDDRANFINYGYGEAIAEGLKGKYPYGGRDLWKVMVSTFSGPFSEEYPSTDKARADALNGFKPTKQDREEAWIKANTPMLLTHLEQHMPILLPKVLWNLVLEYEQITFTWILVQDVIAPPS